MAAAAGGHQAGGVIAGGGGVLRRAAAAVRAVPPLVLFCAVFSFLHWFKPSEPYLVDYVAEHGGIANDVTYDTVYPWYSYTLLPSTLAAGVVFEAAGPAASLLVAAVADVLSVALVIPATAANLAPFIASQFAYSQSFTSLFLVTATLTAALAPRDYQRATSVNRAASLTANMIAAAVGQGMASAGDVAGTVAVSLAFSIASALFLLAFLPRRVLPRGAPCCTCRRPAAAPDAEQQPLPLSPPPASCGAAAGARAAVLARQLAAAVALVARDARAATLAVAQAVLFATHSLALTYWQNLFDVVAPGEDYNGGTMMTAYALSVVATALPAIPAVDRVLQAHGNTVVAASAACAAALLAGMAAAPNLLTAAACFVVYHTVAELALVVLAAQLGRRVATLHAARQSLSAAVAPASDDGVDAFLVPTPKVPLLPHAAAAAGESHDAPPGAPLPPPPPPPRFGAVFAAVSLAAQAIQLALQFSIGPTGAALPMRDRFTTFAGVLAALVAALAFAVCIRPPPACRRAGFC